MLWDSFFSLCFCGACGERSTIARVTCVSRAFFFSSLRPHCACACVRWCASASASCRLRGKREHTDAGNDYVCVCVCMGLRVRAYVCVSAPCALFFTALRSHCASTCSACIVLVSVLVTMLMCVGNYVYVRKGVRAFWCPVSRRARTKLAQFYYRKKTPPK